MDAAQPLASPTACYFITSQPSRSLQKCHRLDTHHLKSLAAPHVLAPHHVVTSNHVALRLGKARPVPLVRPAWQLRPLPPHQPPHLVLVPLPAVGTNHHVPPLLRPFLEELPLFHTRSHLPPASLAAPSRSATRPLQPSPSPPPVPHPPPAKAAPQYYRGAARSAPPRTPIVQGAPR